MARLGCFGHGGGRDLLLALDEGGFDLQVALPEVVTDEQLDLGRAHEPPSALRGRFQHDLLQFRDERRLHLLEARGVILR